MFPPTATSSAPPRRDLRSALRDAADLIVAFVTLESYGVEDLLLRTPPSDQTDDSSQLTHRAGLTTALPSRRGCAPAPPSQRCLRPSFKKTRP